MSTHQAEFTTGEIAKLVQVAPRTVSRWIDTGMLPGRVVPGRGGHRRVGRETLRQFLLDHKLPFKVPGD